MGAESLGIFTSSRLQATAQARSSIVDARRNGLSTSASPTTPICLLAGGLTPEDVRRQHRAIDVMNRRDPAFRIFKGIEADILPDGRLDYDDATLASFDFVIAAVHSHFGMSEDEMTGRLLRPGQPPPQRPRPPRAASCLPRALRSGSRAGHRRACRSRQGHRAERQPHRLDWDWRTASTQAPGRADCRQPRSASHGRTGGHEIRAEHRPKGWLEAPTHQLHGPGGDSAFLAKRQGIARCHGILSCILTE